MRFFATSFRLGLVSLLALFAACASDGPTDSGEDDASARDVFTSPDVGRVDTGDSPDAGDSPDVEVSPDGGEDEDGGVAPDTGSNACPCSFIEDFTGLMNIDSAETTATVDPSGSGFVRADASRVFLSTGTGSAGSFNPMGGQTLAPGMYEFSDVSIGVDLAVAGDLDLRVAGPVTFSNEAEISVAGNLTLVAASTITLDCAFIHATGDVMIQQPGTQGVHLACSNAANPYDEITTDRTMVGNTGSVEVWTRGGLSLGGNGYISTGRTEDLNGRTGSITVRAYGDVILGPHDAYFIAGDSHGVNGTISIFTEGRLALYEDSYLICGRSNGTTRSGGTIKVRAKGIVELHQSSYFITSPQGDIDLISESDVILDGDSYLLTQRDGATPTTLRIRANSLLLSGDADPTSTGNIIANNSRTGGGSVIVDVRKSIIVETDSYIGSSDATCGPGGNVVLRSEGEIHVRDEGFVDGGGSYSDGMCAPLPGGTITLVAGSTVTYGMNALSGGAGSTTGTVSATIDPNYRLGILSAGLEETVSAISLPLSLEGDVARTVTATRTAGIDPPSWMGAYVLLSTDGSTTSFVPASDLTGPLEPGWRYRFDLEARMFDGTSADRFEIDYR